MAQHGKMPATARKRCEEAHRSIEGQRRRIRTISIFRWSRSPPFDINTASNYSKFWLDWTDWEEANGSCSKGGNTRTKCLNKGGEWTPDVHSTWNGCITDRDEPYDVQKSPPILAKATMFQPEQFSPCPAELLPLTTDWSGAQGAHRHHEGGRPHPTSPFGMAWAWMSLMQTEPLNAPAEAAGYNYRKILIVAQRRPEHEEQKVRQRLGP